ncbi:unnamed protein product [Caenorhabditis brenneri]
MDATILAMYNAVMNRNATAAPLVLPMIPVANLDPSTSNSAATVTSNHKAEKESEQRDKTNERFAELQRLARKDYNRKMNQANILQYALKAAIKHEREFYSDPRSRGLNAALERTEHVTIQHLKSFNLPHPTNHITVQRVEKLFEDFRDVVLPVFTPKTAPANPPALLTAATGAAVSDDADKARREIRAIREQNRRDNQADGFGLLRQFIAENKLVPLGNQKIQILECMIDFLKTELTPLPSRIDAALFETGLTQGKQLGKNLAISFFENDVNLFSHTKSLENFIDSQLGPINLSSHVAKLKFDDTAIIKFMSLHPTIIDLNTTIIPSSATTSISNAPTPIPAVVPFPVQFPDSAPTKKFFRP